MLAALVFPRATEALVRAHVPRDALLIASDAFADASSRSRGGEVLVIAVDGGAEACLAAGRPPTMVVGDMDSVTPSTLAACEKAGARIERHPAAKRDTDAALALRHARGATEILFVGAGGGRADHALANMHLLADAAASVAARAVDEDAETWIVTPGRPLTLSLPVGTTLSAIPFDGEVTGISYEGLAYPLTDATMRAGDPYGVSNEAAAPTQRISVRSGRLVVIRPL